MKKVIFWDAKRAPDEKKGFTGVFATRVPHGTEGARRVSGALANGTAYDFSQKEVTVIRGRLRWIDKVGSDYGTKLVLFVESDKYLHRVSFSYDAVTLRTVMNNIRGLSKDIETAFLNISYWVRPDKDTNGVQKVSATGKPIYRETPTFQDISPMYDSEAYKAVVKEKGLEWQQVTDATGKKTWRQDAEFKFWDTELVRTQRFLLSTETVLPFTYNSLTCCEAANPSGGGNLTSGEIELTREIYEKIKTAYVFPFRSADVDADDFESQSAPTATNTSSAAPQADTGFPASETTYVHDTSCTDDLPF